MCALVRKEQGNAVTRELETELGSGRALRTRSFDSFTETLLDERYIDEVAVLEKSCFTSPWTRELVVSEFANRFAFNGGILSSDELIAYLLSHLVCDELHILTFAVHPECRRTGLGRRLLGFMLREAFTRGARYATLEVRVTNFSAQALYLQMGFSVLGKRRRYYSDNGEDALILGCTLS